VHRFVALTPEVERGLMAKGVRADRIVTIPNGVETSNGHQLPEPGTAKRMFGLRPQTRTVLYLGRLVADKGIAWLLEAWADLLPDHPECRLLVVGDGPEGERLQALSRQLGLISAVRFLGHRHDVEAVLSIGDILVLPSRSEGMSNALLEAMSRGLAVIATDVPGNRAVVDHDRDGLLVPHGDRGALRQALGALLADEPRRRALGRRAAAKMASTFSIEAVARAYDRLYRDLGGDRA
jgi:glycosyltransferase involved in cell wall biosynthesis